MLKLKPVLFILLSSIITACALGDVSNATPPPPITLAPPPALNLVGTCDETKTLENWLQVTSELRASFQTQMNATAAKSKAEMYADVLELAALRDSSFEVATPDCAAETGIKLSDAMSQTVTAFQMYVNGDTPDLGNTIADMNGQIDQIAAMQNDLIDRMNTQFQQQREATTAP